MLNFTKPSYNNQAASSHLIQLDILRGVAILLVIWNHIPIEPRDAGIFQTFALQGRRFGWTGVDLFFVLSGFLIGGLLFRELRQHSHLDVKRFLIRRAFKIWPSYFLFITLVTLSLVISGWLGNKRLLLDSLMLMLPNFLHIQNYILTPRPHTWSLAVEEHFYLLLPFLLSILMPRGQVLSTKSKFRCDLRLIPWIALTLLVMLAILRYITFIGYLPSGVSNAEWHSVVYFPTHLRIDSLFFGVFLAYLYNFQPDRLAFAKRHPILLIVIGFLLLLPMPILGLPMFTNTIGFTTLTLGYSCILLAMVHVEPGIGQLGRFFTSRLGSVLAYVGLFSYPIYLWHRDLASLIARPVGKIILYGSQSHWWPTLWPSMAYVLMTGVFAVASICVGIIASVLIEKPTLALRDRVFPARATALGDSAEPHIEDVKHATIKPHPEETMT